MRGLLALDLAGRRVLMAGGGPAAARRCSELLRLGADVLVVAPAICEDLVDLVQVGAIGWHDGEPTETDLDGAWLAVAATGEPGLDAAVAGWADQRRIWCEGGSARAVPTIAHGGFRVGVDADWDGSRVLAAVDTFLAGGGADLRTGARGGRVTLVGGGPGDPDLITVGGRRALASADVVVADRLGPTTLLAGLPADVEVIDVGKAPGNHPVPQEEINALLVEHAHRGRHVVRLKGGDPFVLGRGGEEALACAAAGVPVTVVPGVTSAVAVPAAAGIPVTHRGVSTGYLVVTGHAGLPPAALAALRDRSATVVVLMGVTMLPELTRAALSAGVDPELPVAIIEHGTTDRQRVLRAVLAQAGTLVAEAPAVIVLGDTAALDLGTG